jgi:hypothetical protein
MNLRLDYLRRKYKRANYARRNAQAAAAARSRKREGMIAIEFPWTFVELRLMRFLEAEASAAAPEVPQSAGYRNPGAVLRRVPNPRPANPLAHSPVPNAIESALSQRVVAGPSVLPNDRSAWMRRLQDLQRKNREAEIKLREAKAEILGVCMSACGYRFTTTESTAD